MISLKDLNEIHLEKMVEWRSSERINKVSYTDVILNIEDQKKWFKSVQKDETKKYYAIYYKNKHIGICYLTDISFKNSSCSFGLYIGEENYLISGAGFISELKLIHIAFKEFKVNRIHCEVLDLNKNVVQLHKKFGFVQEGVLRSYIQKNNQFHNVVILSLLKKDWELVSFRFDKYIFN